MDDKAVVLLSGGLDSATALAIAKHEGFQLYTLSFDYGQRHAVELQSVYNGNRMFENLSSRLEGIYKKLKGRGKLKEADVDEALREIRVALIEADVGISVIKDFLAAIREKAIGHEVLKSLTPGHQMVKIVNDELTALFGDSVSDIQFAPKPPTVILMVGLQGSGKTTTAGKLARMLKHNGKKCLLVPADVYRPAAIEQLNVLGKSLDIDVYQAGGEADPVAICRCVWRFGFRYPVCA